MKQQYVSPIDGIELERTDVDQISKNAALAEDYVFSELLRLPNLGASPPTRGVLPASIGGSAIVRPSGAADARVNVNAFRAFVRYSATPSEIEAAWTEVRSTPVIGAGTDPFQQLQHSAATNNRWDLVYVRLNVDGPDTDQTRYVKDVDDNVTSGPFTISKLTTATIGIVQGSEATTPARPTVPADSSQSYYIPIAYVLLPAGHTLTTAIAPQNIFEVASALQLSGSTGAATLAIASGMSTLAGTAVATETWSPTSGRPSGFLPQTMGGKKELVIPLHFGALGGNTITPGTTGVVDDSIDWRKRVFKMFVACGSTDNTIDYSMPWMPGGGGVGTGWIPDSANSALGAFTPLPLFWTMAHSFRVTTSGVKASLAILLPDLQFPTASNGMATATTVELFVDMSNGKLMCQVSGASPKAEFIIWLEATGQFNNCF